MSRTEKKSSEVRNNAAAVTGPCDDVMVGVREEAGYRDVPTYLKYSFYHIHCTLYTIIF